MGLAVYNGINLDIKLPYVAYKKLLSPAVVPLGNPNATVGVIPDPTIHDLDSFMPVRCNISSTSLNIKFNFQIFWRNIFRRHC